MKKSLVLVLTLILIICSCNNDVPDPQQVSSLLVQPDITAFLCNGQDVQLEISAAPGIEYFDSIQWYETDAKGNVLTLLDEATSSEYVVEAFDSNQIKYYVCKVSKGNRTDTSSVFSVAHTGLPFVSVTTDGSKITRETWLAADFDANGKALTGEIKGRGNSSWFYNKKNYSIKLSDKEKMFGMPKHKRWVLIANTIDSSLLRNYFASYLGNNVFTGHGWNPSFVFVDMVLDGVYWGNYIFGEQIKIAGNRVDIKDISDEDAGVGNGGFIAEVNMWKDEAFNFETDRGISISLKDPDEVSEEIQQFVKQTIQTAEDALYGNDFKDEQIGYAKYFDVDSVIDWYLVNEIASNYDASFRTSVYLYYDNADGKIHMGPNWDFDRSCGIGVKKPTSFRIRNSGWIKRLFEDPAFENKVKTRYSEVRTELGNAVDKLTEMADGISISALLNNFRWKNLEDFGRSVDSLQTWLNAKLEWLDTQWLESN